MVILFTIMGIIVAGLILFGIFSLFKEENKEKENYNEIKNSEKEKTKKSEWDKISQKRIILAYASNAITPGLGFLIAKGTKGLTPFIVYLIIIIYILTNKNIPIDSKSTLGQLLNFIAVIHLFFSIKTTSLKATIIGIIILIILAGIITTIIPLIM